MGTISKETANRINDAATIARLKALLSKCFDKLDDQKLRDEIFKELK